MTKEETQEYLKEYGIKNKEKLSEYNKEWRKKNPDYYKKYNREHRKEKNEHLKEWRENNPELNKEYSKNTYYKTRYNLTTVDKQKMLEKQNNKCANENCKKEINMTTGCIDHDHITGKIRGLLCSNCNTGLGMFKDNVNLLQGIINYINKTK